ncbi:MAG: hypothetical protein Q7U76_12730 [Nitrospirota bacterium]|nr:hypothetical protein [Nitrospirota bacterium]
MTCRSKRMGKHGDTFLAFGENFLLTHVFRCRLGYVVSDAFMQEGCANPQELIEIWNGIHPTVGYDPEVIVWAHCFHKVHP